MRNLLKRHRLLAFTSVVMCATAIVIVLRVDRAKAMVKEQLAEDLWNWKQSGNYSQLKAEEMERWQIYAGSLKNYNSQADLMRSIKVRVGVLGYRAILPINDSFSVAFSMQKNRERDRWAAGDVAYVNESH